MKKTTGGLEMAALRPSGKSVLLSFTLECAGQPVLSFAAPSIAAARKMGREQWLRDEMRRYLNNGSPLWDGIADLTVRPATVFEHGEVIVERLHQVSYGEDAKYSFAFLVPIDPERN